MKCVVCKNNIKPDLILKGKEGIGDILRCPDCYLTFSYPQPDHQTISEYYNGFYSQLTNSFDEQKLNWAKLSTRKYCRELNLEGKTYEKIKVLDLGGGLGYYSKAFSDLGFDVTLVEVDQNSADFAKRVLGIKHIFQCDFESFFVKHTDLKYDIIIFRHVIEHVRDPDYMIKNISNLLVTNGSLVIETDNNAGIELLTRPKVSKYYLNLYRKNYDNISKRKLLIKRPFAVDPPRHLFGFRMNNLSDLLKEHDLVSVKKVHYRLGHPSYWPNLPLPSMRKTINNILKGKLKLVLVDFTEYAIFPLRVTLQIFGLSSGICIYAKKVR